MADPWIDEQDIRYTEASLKEAGAVIADFIREQVADGLDADGDPLPPGIDLRESGALLSSIEGRVDQGEIIIVCDVPYAGIVNARYRFMGVAPSRIAELERRLQPILARGAYYAESAGS